MALEAKRYLARLEGMKPGTNKPIYSPITGVCGQAVPNYYAGARTLGMKGQKPILMYADDKCAGGGGLDTKRYNARLIGMKPGTQKPIYAVYCGACQTCCDPCGILPAFRTVTISGFVASVGPYVIDGQAFTCPYLNLDCDCSWADFNDTRANGPFDCFGRTFDSAIFTAVVVKSPRVANKTWLNCHVSGCKWLGTFMGFPIEQRFDCDTLQISYDDPCPPITFSGDVNVRLGQSSGCAYVGQGQIIGTIHVAVT